MNPVAHPTISLRDGRVHYVIAYCVPVHALAAAEKGDADNCQPNLHDAAFPTRCLTASATYACGQLAKSSTEPFRV